MKTRWTLTLGAVLALAVTVAACGSGSGGGYGGSPMAPSPVPTPTPPANGGADLLITITGQNGAQSFSPNPGALTTGQKVAFYNADSIVHSIAADGGAFATGNIGPGGMSSVITMSTAGAYPYHCVIHPTMVGTLNVTNAAGGGY